MSLNLHIEGAIRGGKNHMGVSRTGRHYPRPEFVQWREQAMLQLLHQWVEQGKKVIAHHAIMNVNYVPSDKRRRDVPAMIDAIFHCLERLGILKDDSLIKDINWKQYNVGSPGAYIELQEKIED